MAVERVLRDLEALLGACELRRAARHRGVSAPAAGREAELAEDLVRRDVVARVRARVDRGTVDPWVGDSLVRLAVQARTRAERSALCERRRRWRGPAGVTLPGLEAWLAARPEPAAARATREAVEQQLDDEARAAESFSKARATALRELGVAQPDWWTRVRDRDHRQISALAQGLLECQEGPMRQWLAESAARELPVDLAGSWVALPRLIAGWREGTGLPPIDRELIEHVLSSLGLASVADRLEVDPETRPGKASGGGSFRTAPGRGLIVWVPKGPLRDLAVALELLGRTLPAVLAEDLGSGPEAYSGDPAVAAAYAAVFESLCCQGEWLEYTFRRPLSPAARRALRAIVRTRMRWFAALVGTDARCWSDPEWTHRAPAERLRRATGLVHPDRPLPWHAPPGPAADEIAGMAVGAALRDLLATRWGRDWYRCSRAGRWLRDVWAAGHRRLSDLCSDLDLEGPLAGDALFESLQEHALSS